MFDIIGKRYFLIFLSALILVPGTISLLLWGIPVSIDYKGGTVYHLEFEAGAKVADSDVVALYAEQGISDAQVVTVVADEGKGPAFQIRSSEIVPEAKNKLDAALDAKFGPHTTLRFESVGASVGALVTRNAGIAVIFSSILICLYLTLQFRHLQHPIRYGVAAIAALLHDVLVVLGLASLIGHFMGWEVDALFLTALLTVIGFSVHDSIVVFDRIRENSGRLRGLSFERIVNHSIVQTLDRSINTQLTALFTLFAIYVFSTGQLHRFLFWLIIGLISGTYSSIANAAPILVIWSNREWQHWFGRGKDDGLVAAG
ncbi:MAG: protein translocase subunit SecF [Ardenticatenales bacterium]